MPDVWHNPKFAHLTQPPNGLCWWCGEPATTREHKYKRTDLDVLGESGQLLWGGDPERTYEIKSNRKSDSVRFSRSLCARCNNDRSQPFDRAYDTYRDYVLSHIDSLWGRQHFDMQAIYGDDWAIEQAHLARYFVKHFGCRLVEGGFVPPAQMSQFLNGESSMPNVHLAFVAIADEAARYALSAQEGGNGIRYQLQSLYCWPADGSPLNRLATSTYISYLGVRFTWCIDVAVTQSSFFPARHPLINYFDDDEAAAAPHP